MKVVMIGADRSVKGGVSAMVNNLYEAGLDRRVELMFPVEQEELFNRVFDVLKLQWKDNVKARVMTSDGGFKKPEPPEDAPRVNAQETLMHWAHGHWGE